MVIKRYPHTATISYYGAGSTNSIGIYTEGTTVATVIACNIQPNTTRYIIGASGDMIGYSYNIFFEIYDGVNDVPADAKLTFFDKEHVILDLFPYQKHVEVKV